MDKYIFIFALSYIGAGALQVMKDLGTDAIDQPVWAFFVGLVCAVCGMEDRHLTLAQVVGTVASVFVGAAILGRIVKHPQDGAIGFGRGMYLVLIGIIVTSPMWASYYWWLSS